MRLKHIKLAGFKSFVDPTTVSLPSNMCAVVGPNGCGKSNVIDAVRWVMGESSAKNLRGESMADVIFNGSVNRKPVGQASIELVFDNSDGGIGGEYASYAEISTRRVVTREGQSDYYLNGTRCRRRDITDLFLGTGLGPRSYAIIEQGMISRLIESRPEELRVFIEEAAGISRYKERRRETESRMRRTLENLERLTDLREELERQLQHLQRQAEAAEKYREFKREERELKAQLHALNWRDLNAQAAECARAVGELELQVESVLTERQQVDTRIETLRATHAERTDTFNRVQGRYYSVGAEVARLEQTIRFQQERAREQRADLERTGRELEQARRHLDEDAGRRGQWEEELAGLSPELALLRASEEESAEQLAAAEEAMQAWQLEWDSFNQRAAGPRQTAEVQQSRIQHLEHAMKRLQARLQQLQAQQEQLGEDGGEDEAGPLREALAENELRMEEHEQRAEAASGALAEARDEAAQAASQLNALRGELQQLGGRIASLEALQQSAAEDGSEEAAAWWQAQGLADAPRLLARLQVEEPWQLAVERVLGEALQSVCVDSLDAVAGAIDSLHKGALLAVEPAAPAPAPAGTLAAMTRGAGALAGLLAAVRTAPDLDSAMAMRAALADHESVITPDGVRLGPCWLSAQRGEQDRQAGVIRRQQELEQLTTRRAGLEREEGGLTAQLQACEARAHELEQQRQQAQRELQAATREHADIAARLRALEARSEQLAARREALRHDMEDAGSQFAQEQAAVAEARGLLAEAIEHMEADAGEREALLSRRDGTRSALDSARQQARQARDSAQQAIMRERSLQSQLETMRNAIDRARTQVEQLSARRESLELAIAEAEEPLDALQLELDGQLNLRLGAETELAEARNAVAEVDQALRENEQQRAGIEQRVGTARAALEQERLRRQTLEVEQAGLERQLEELGATPAGVLEGLPPEAEPGEWQRRLERVTARIARLGMINLAAIDEYSQQSERKRYLDAQDEDLNTALATLESAIRKIDKETRSRFQATFDQVNGGLQELFPRVFGGGHAYLEMTGEDLLDTGISIMARPPGKKNSTIHLLSGGEKALTAIALVFSIFQLNPAPFCMLDEVDAPLDDANVGRYARMVKEMSAKVQFIFITHNKITMEMADQLLGVTMHEPGVSRLVSVDVEEAAELAAS